MHGKTIIKHIRYLLVVFAMMALSFHLSAEPSAIDSLEHALQLHPAEDSTRMNTLILLCTTYLNEKNDRVKVTTYLPEINRLSKKLNSKTGRAHSILYTEIVNTQNRNYIQSVNTYLKALKQLQEVGNKSGISLCYQFMAVAYYFIGNYEACIQCNLKSIQIKREEGDHLSIANNYNNMGNAYLNLAKYQKALQYYLRSLKIKEEIKDKFGISRTLLNIACVFYFQGKPDMALAYQQKSLKMKIEIGDKEGQGIIYIDMADIYSSQKKYQDAMVCCLKAIKISEEIGNMETRANAFINIGNLYAAQDKFNQALPYYQKAYEVSIQIDNEINIISAANGLGNCYEHGHAYEKAIVFYTKALNMSKETKYNAGVKDAYGNLSSISEKMDNYRQALLYNKLYSEIKDTMLNEESMKQTAELHTKYETDKKEKEILLLTKDQLLKDKTLKEQRLVRIGLIIGLGLFLALSFLLFNRYRYKQKANLILEKQKQEIEQKNVLITDSIDYAKTIQEAILPDTEKLTLLLPDHFILYKPKAIVSGDFYWIGKKDGKTICAVADCTGHGVPGAFMSLLGHNILENVIQRDVAIDPGTMLTLLNEEIVTRFTRSKERETVKHGMDIALICIDNEKQQLQYAGARNSLYHVRQEVLTELKADKQSTGIEARDHTIVNYNTSTCALQKGDMLYMFSDGFPDQKGGPDKKKFFYQPFKELLRGISKLPVAEQKQHLEKAITDWIGAGEQIDDILVMGIRI
jgi:tetratricopeptide (TPR) repeat protein